MTTDLTEDEIQTLERISNTLGGMRFDRRIPADTNLCIQGLGADLDTIISRITAGDEDDEEPDWDQMRDDRDERRRLAKEDDE